MNNNSLWERMAGYGKQVAQPFQAIADPTFRADVAKNARVMAGMQSSEGLGLPSEQAMAKMNWGDLLQLRKQHTSADQQNALAPYEHRAYTREYTNGPMDALQNVMLTGAYTPYKAATGVGRSQPSMKSVGQGLYGIWEGMTR